MIRLQLVGKKFNVILDAEHKEYSYTHGNEWGDYDYLQIYFSGVAKIINIEIFEEKVFNFKTIGLEG